MLSELSGWAWFLVILGGPVLLGVAMAYGAMRSHRRSKMRKIHTRDTQSTHRA